MVFDSELYPLHIEKKNKNKNRDALTCRGQPKVIHQQWDLGPGSSVCSPPLSLKLMDCSFTKMCVRGSQSCSLCGT